jgi:hypothetical protein
MAKILQNSTGALVYHFQTAGGDYAVPDFIELKIFDPDGIEIEHFKNPPYMGSGVYQYILSPQQTKKCGRYEAHWHTRKQLADIVDIEYFDVVRVEDEYIVGVHDVKEFLDIDQKDESQDKLIRQLIFAFQGIAEKYCNRPLKPTGVIDERHDGDGSRELLLHHYPILDISKVEVVGVYIIPERNLRQGYSEGFIAEFDTGIITLTDKYIFPKGQGNILVSYIHGYDEIPYDLREVALEWIATKLEDRKSLNIKSERLGPYTVTYDTDFVPKNVLSVLERYKKRWELGR